MKHWRLAGIGLCTLLLSMSAVAVDGGEGGGTITGTITLDGRPTSDVVVSVSGPGGVALEGQPVEEKPKLVTVDQRRNTFIPRVSAVKLGALVNFPNNDTSWHNVYSASEAKSFDLGLYPRGESRGVTMDKAGVVRVLCNVHPSMEAFIVVKGHGYYSVANHRGGYRITGLDSGEYRLEVWHPELGTRLEAFRIARPGEVRTVDINLKKLR